MTMPDREDGPDPADYAEPPPERTAENACPECATGVIVSAGPMEYDTGHYPEVCSARCGWTN